MKTLKKLIVITIIIVITSCSQTVKKTYYPKDHGRMPLQKVKQNKKKYNQKKKYKGTFSNYSTDRNGKYRKS